jgi:hypothetical protein
MLLVSYSKDEFNCRVVLELDGELFLDGKVQKRKNLEIYRDAKGSEIEMYSKQGSPSDWVESYLQGTQEKGYIRENMI